LQPHDYWQDILPASAAFDPPFQDLYPARLADGRALILPIRPLKGTNNAIASLILNQASFLVESTLADDLCEQLQRFQPDLIVGMPTLGLSLARAVAERLGHSRYIALGASKKFWYDEALSVPLNSITSPGGGKRLYLDPRMLPLLKSTRVCLIDDVISSGASICAGLDLLKLVDVVPSVLGAAMLQTHRWTKRVSENQNGAELCAVGAFKTPLLTKTQGGWVVEAAPKD